MSKTSRSVAKLSSFNVATLWHRRLARTRVSSVKVQPRVCAELILHPVVSHRPSPDAARVLPKERLDASHAA
jgi:hypothetical protein